VRPKILARSVLGRNRRAGYALVGQLYGNPNFTMGKTVRNVHMKENDIRKLDLLEFNKITRPPVMRVGTGFDLGLNIEEYLSAIISKEKLSLHHESIVPAMTYFNTNRSMPYTYIFYKLGDERDIFLVVIIDNEQKAFHGYYIDSWRRRSEAIQQSPVEGNARIIIKHPWTMGCASCLSALTNPESFNAEPKDIHLHPLDTGYNDVNPYLIEIVAIEKKEEGWSAKGRGEVDTTRCSLCGMTYEVITKAIPIHCHTFTCPKCGEKEHLSYKVNQIHTELQTFEFEAEIRCEACSNKRSIKKTIQRILDVVKIEVGLKGISVTKP
jgi:hypothetical protein